MFCQFCGEEVVTDGSFCPVCGKKIGSVKKEVVADEPKYLDNAYGFGKRKTNVSVDNIVKIGVKQNVFQERVDSVEDAGINDALFSLYNALIPPISLIEEHMQRISTAEAEIEELKPYYKVKTPWWLIVILFFVFYFIFSSAGFSRQDALVKEWKELSKTGQTNLDWPEYAKQNGHHPFFVVYGMMSEESAEFAFIGIAFAIPIVCTVIAERFIRKKRSDAEHSKNMKRVQELQQEIENVIYNRDTVVDAIKEQIQYVNPKFRNSNALKYMTNLYRNGEVDTLKEAQAKFVEKQYHDEQLQATYAVVSVLSSIAYTSRETMSAVQNIDNKILW